MTLEQEADEARAALAGFGEALMDATRIREFIAWLNRGIEHRPRPIGNWLCGRNRHRRVWTPEVPPGLVVRGMGIPDHAYVAEPGPGSSTVTTVNPVNVFTIACQVPECPRCAAPLRLSIRRWLGWESYGAG